MTWTNEAAEKAEHVSAKLTQTLRHLIETQPQQRIPFSMFMETALYDSAYGYYATNQANIGGQGDFYTSPHVGAEFGEALAEQFAEMWAKLGYPHPFTLVEMGAGQGLLVRDVLRYLHRHHDACFDAVEYIVVEASPALVAHQQQRLGKLAQSLGRLHWRTWQDIKPDSIVGCCFSNELVDAFPVHRVALVKGQLQEVYVALAEKRDEPSRDAGALAQGEGTGAIAPTPLLDPLDSEQLNLSDPSTWFAPSPALQLVQSSDFQEVLGDLSTPQLLAYFQHVGIELSLEQYGEGYCTEVNLAAQDWMQTVAQRLRRGYVLTIDYGYLAQRYYLPSRRQGTLQCYYQHRVHNNPYIHLGQQDITAHVDFTALQQWGRQAGLESLSFTQQGLFLMALGLGDRIAAIAQMEPDASRSISDILARREALHSLINPTGLGGFGVLLQGKGVEEDGRSLRGFQMP
ncbi:MAG: class I SAM-dependent methyltransferase [Kaiparowitsia implicata GSE-PSE-MK54-09C]|jgi:SAM-dependent MidA family methyltransferase|nr:class I SAM-dependent methyltransferase [Kaiparowitsia implicata GSE-PSE-MK54-09C]